jgi:hypothetical protein
MEKGKRKIIKDRDLPSSEQISKYQDFERVLNNASSASVAQKLLLKKGIIWGSVVAGAIGVAGLVYLNSGSDPKKQTAETNNEPKKIENCIQPPIPGKEMPYAEYRINAKEGGIIKYGTGTSITIPANAFKRKDGKPVSDSIDIKYREFHTPLDVFLSGIPMEYDSAGVKRTFETAGMLEIKANDKGNDLELKEETPIDVRMATTSLDPRFNLYDLDTASKNWIYKGKDQIEQAQESKKFSPKKEQVKPTMTDKTIRPVLADPKKFKFTIKSDKNQFPELAAYDKVMFEENDNSFNPKYYKVNWKNITLHDGGTHGNYIAKLYIADTIISVPVHPVFSKENFDEAMKQFEAKHAAANKVTEAKEAEEQKKVDKVNKELAVYESKKMIQAAYNVAGVSVGFRNVTVRSFGIHNLDFPLFSAIGYAFRLVSNSFKKNNANETTSAYSDIYLVEKGKNAVFRFQRGEPVRCNPKAQNLMWTLTNANQVAFFRINDYSKLVNGGENSVVPVVEPDQQKAFDEIRKFSL